MIFINKTRKERRQQEYKDELEYHKCKLRQLQNEIPYSNYYGLDWTKKQREKAESYTDNIIKEKETIIKLIKNRSYYIP